MAGYKARGGDRVMEQAGRGRLRDDIGRLVEMVSACGVSVRPEAHDTLAGLAETIHEWNKRVNLVSRKDIERLVTYHFCDAASLLPVISPGTGTDVLDVGGSNGVPGLVLAAISPDIAVTVCDSRQKREGFLKEACALIGDRASYVMDRVEAEIFRTENAAKYDLIVARAVTRLKLLLKWCLPLVRPGGVLAAYKGSRCSEEVGQAEGYLWSHGAGFVMVLGSPFASNCNPFRQFAVVGKSS
jgi:16S rRNA (guanine527-N7)-methyltransferase